MISLHWLPEQNRIDFNILLLMYKSSHGLALTYLSELLIEYQSRRRLRSTTQNVLKVTRTKLSQKEDRVFAAAAPRLCNSLPLYVRDADSVHALRHS